MSGHTFVQAYYDLQLEIAEANAEGRPTIGLLTSLSTSTMEPAFVEHCRRGATFSLDVASRLLGEYQLPAKARADGGRLTKKRLEELSVEAVDAAENLLSETERFSHGRLIGPEEARDDVGLNVLVMDPDDPVWQGYWELYVRAEVCMQQIVPDRRARKLFIDRNSVVPVF